MKGILLTIFVAGICYFSFSDSQKKSNGKDDNSKISDRLIIMNCCNNEDFKDTCLTLMEKVQEGLLKYEQYGTLLDTSGTEINKNSIQRFYSMFIYGKKQSLINDLNWMKKINGVLQPTKIETISAEKYAELAYFVHKENGFKFKLNQPVCTSIRYDDYHESYFITVFARKDFYSRIDEEGKSVEMMNGNIGVKIQFDIPEYDFEKIKIRKLYN